MWTAWLVAMRRGWDDWTLYSTLGPTLAVVEAWEDTVEWAGPVEVWGEWSRGRTRNQSSVISSIVGDRDDHRWHEAQRWVWSVRLPTRDWELQAINWDYKRMYMYVCCIIQINGRSLNKNSHCPIIMSKLINYCCLNLKQNVLYICAERVVQNSTSWGINVGHASIK